VLIAHHAAQLKADALRRIDELEQAIAAQAHPAP
jgi:hypothetical protein